MRLFRSNKGDEFAETAIAMPVIVLITIALLNLTMAGFASVNANNAANYGARVGSVNQQGPAGTAYEAALQSISYAKIGDYSVSVTGGGFPGAQISVQVDWSVPNLMGGLLSFVGGNSLGADLAGSAVSVFRQEGW
ncbi:MAG: hypothetical protein HYR70_04320 [Chloroflexi bacterium]|nr:hypothetical protein [Chloroflexota bacterium]MBI3340782.1 hypothetical protein [Chloroflexota bacterium]